MPKSLKNYGLSLAMFGLFLLFLISQSIVGYYDYNNGQHDHQQSSISYMAYLTRGHLWARVFENWESEFLQMSAYVIFTVFLFQRGSAESKDPQKKEAVDEDPRQHQHDPQAPGPVRKGGLVLKLYAHSLSTVLFLLFLLSFLGHAAGGTKAYNEEQREHGGAPVSMIQYVGTS
jgi:hypothetical protein